MKLTTLEKIASSSMFNLPNRIISRRLAQLANSERGSCYILGNGWSLKHIDFNKLENRPTIACNFMFLHQDFSKLNVKHYLFLDPIKTISVPKSELADALLEQIRTKPDTNFYLGARDLLKQRRVNVYHLLPVGTNWPGNSSSDKRGLFSAANKPLIGSLRGQLALAVFLGFERATLIGHDYLLSPSRSGHFYEDQLDEHTNLNGWNSDFITQIKKYIELDILSPTGYSSNLLNTAINSTQILSTEIPGRSIPLTTEKLRMLISVNAANNFGFKFTDTKFTEL